MFPTRNGLKQGDALKPFFFTIVLDYGIMRFRVNKDGWKLNGTH